MKVNNEEIQAYFNDVQVHDWYYEMSDDHRKWTKGKDREKELKLISETNGTFSKIFHAFKDYHNNNIKGTPSKKPLVEDFLKKGEKQ